MKTITSVSTKKRKAQSREPKLRKRLRNVISLKIMQNHSDIVE